MSPGEWADALSKLRSTKRAMLELSDEDWVSSRARSWLRVWAGARPVQRMKGERYGDRDYKWIDRTWKAVEIHPWAAPGRVATELWDKMAKGRNVSGACVDFKTKREAWAALLEACQG